LRLETTTTPHNEHVGALEAQHAAIRREYRTQADAWSRRPIDAHLAWVVEQVTWDPAWRVVDVAAGTALFARAIATRVRSIVAVDLTPEMLTRGRDLARAQGLTTIRFEQGAVERLPFADASFDAVVTRYSIHHFREPALALREMARVCRADGQLVLVDMVADDDPRVADRHNELERTADRTHTAMLSPQRLIAAVVDAGFALEKYLSREVDMVFDAWQPQLANESPERQVIRAALEEELAGRGESGMRPVVRDGVLMFRHTWGIVIARRPRRR